VLAYGEGQSASAVDLARNLADGTVPASFTSQGALYDKVITSQPSGDLAGYYKDASFRQVTGDTTTLPGATIVRDTTHQVPHIYGQTRQAAMYAAGYATAQDRLFLMDVLRRTAEGSTAELLGPSAVPADSAALGQFDLSPAELTAEATGTTSPFSGFRLTGFTNAEETQAGLAEKAPWLLQDRLVALGAEFVEGEPWAPHVVVDRSLYTGQNPASSGPLAERMLEALSA
jgi:putative intracellular protease/amidase